MARRIAGRKYGGVSSRSLAVEAVKGRHLHDDMFAGKYVYEVCDHQPVAVDVNGYAPPSGVDTESFRVKFRNGGELLGTYIGTGTQLAPILTDGRFQISLDEVAADGVEYGLVTQNGSSAYGPHVLHRTVSPRWFFRAKLLIADVSEIKHCAVGVRAPAAVEAALADYEDFAVLDVDNGNVLFITNTDNGGAVSVDTLENIVDGQEFEIMAKVDTDFNVELFLDGSPLGLAPKFAIHADPTQLQFFIATLQEGAGSVIRLNEFEAGPLYHVDADPDRR